MERLQERAEANGNDEAVYPHTLVISGVYRDYVDRIRFPPPDRAKHLTLHR